MIDDERYRQTQQQILEFHHVGGVEMQHYVPVQVLDAIQDAVKFIHVRHAAQVAYEVEAYTANATRVQVLEILVAEEIVDVGHAAVFAVALGDGIDNDGIVRAVATGVDQHGALQPQGLLQFLEAFQRRIRRCIGAVGRVRILVAGTEDMAMGVAGIGWRLELRRFGIGIGRHTHWYSHRLSARRFMLPGITSSTPAVPVRNKG